MSLYNIDLDDYCECDAPDFAWNEDGEYRCLVCGGVQVGAVYADRDSDDGLCPVCAGTGANPRGGKCRHCRGVGGL